MNILYDHQIFVDVYGGISRYFSELMRQFNQKGGLTFALPVWCSNNYYLRQNLGKDHKIFFNDWKFRGKTHFMLFLNNMKSRNALLGQEFDVFHPTYYDPYFLKYINRKPFVLTIFDMIHESFPQYFHAKDYTSRNKRFLAGRASKIIAISEATKKDIVRLYNIPEDKITVIYLGESLSGLRACKPAGNIPSQYILFVGSRKGYKNFFFFIKSITPLIKKDPHLHVICAGGGSFDLAENTMLKELGLENHVHYFGATDKNMRWFYQNAVAFVFPSLYEGFGIPILEAFASGCPVILSQSSALAEIGAEAAVYFDPRSEISIRESVSKVIEQPALRGHLRGEGQKRLKQFSWIKTAEQTQELYRSLL